MMTVVSMAVASAARAQSDTAALDWRLEAQPLNRTLALWSARTGIQVVAASTTSGVRSRRIYARLPARAALQRIVAGTGYEARFIGVHTVAVRLGKAKHASSVVRNEAPREVPADIVVTGTRLPTLTRNAIMPLRAMDRRELESTGQSDLATALLQIGAIQPGLGLQTSQNQTSGGAGLSLVDLRGLGVARTLVLINGHRQVGARRGLSAVDLNTIPPAMVERVEVTTGGASAVYGADAVAGVVNIVLRQDPTDGIEARATSALSWRGDAAARGVSLRWGRRDIGASGWSIGGGFYRDTIAPVDATARDYASDGLDVIANDSGLVTVPGIRFATVDPAGSYAINGIRYVFTPEGGSARVYDRGVAVVRDGRQRGGDGLAPQRYDQLRLGLTRTAGDLTLGWVTGDHRFGVTARVVATTARSTWQPMIFPNDRAALSLAIDNPFLPAVTVAAMNAGNVRRIDIAKALESTGRVGSINRRTMIDAHWTADGALGAGWRYSLDAGWGRSHDAIVTTGVADDDRLRQAVDAVRDPVSGAVVCRDAAARAAGCLPFNIVGLTAPDPAALAWVRIAPHASETLTQLVTSGSVTGHPLVLPDGPLEATIGWEARRETSDRRSSAIQERGGTYLPQVPSYVGSYGVVEMLGELSAPLLIHRAGAERLSLTAAVRISRYSTVGTAGAWHVGLDYAPVAAFRFRAKRSRAVRAPNIGELYGGPAQGYAFVVDPCDAARRGTVIGRAAQCEAQGLPDTFDGQNGIAKPVTYVSNPGLRSELADTSTLGVTWDSGALGVTLDGWRIRVERAIGFPLEQATLNDCADATDEVRRLVACNAITRDPETGRLIALRATVTNIGRIDTAGIDLAAHWRPATSIRGGSVDLSSTVTWVNRLAVTPDATAGTTVRLDGVLPNPRLRATLAAGWSGGGFAFGWQPRVIGSARITDDTSLTIDRATTGLRSYHDLSISKRLQAATLRLDIANVFDAAPPRRGFQTSQGIGAAALFPNLGRLARLSATATF